MIIIFLRHAVWLGLFIHFHNNAVPIIGRGAIDILNCPVQGTTLLGTGAVLTQITETDDSREERKVVAYARRTLTEVEISSSQTEREALAITWACECFHLYVYGTEFVVLTDHTPLLPRFNNPRAQLPTRIERWQLRLQPYNMEVIHRPGADFLSRHPLEGQPTSDRNIADVYIC